MTKDNTPQNMKDTQQIDLTATADVPTADGGVITKRILDLTPEDLHAIAEQYRAQVEATAHQARDDEPQAITPSDES
jgi:hypothetical protein